MKATNLDLIVHNRQLSTVPILNKMLVILVEIEDQPPVVEEIDEQVQDAANTGFQEGLLLEEEMA